MKSLKIIDLIDLEQLQKLQDTFSRATGVASIITDIEGKPITAPSYFCRLCMDIIRKTEKGLRNCMYSDAQIGGQKDVVIQRCLSGGLMDGGTPIVVEGRHIANWLIGQIRLTDMDTESMISYAREIGADREEFLKALEEVPFMDEEQFKSIAEMLALFARHLSRLAFENRSLERSENYIREIIRAMGDGLISTDRKGEIREFNPAAEEITGWKMNDASGRNIKEVLPLIPLTDESRSREALTLNREGRQRRIIFSASDLPSREEGGSTLYVIRDVTEARQMEAQLRQSQKMDALGRLTGGIAHDFNNMLTGILGAADMLDSRDDLDEEARKLIGTIISAAEKAGNLTKGLLDFSRKEQGGTSEFDLHEAVGGAIAILERSINKKIILKSDLQAIKSYINGNPAQVESVIINLGLNAQDAMPEGGEILIETANVYLNDRKKSFYILLTLSDNGSGMTEDQAAHIFEPFYTTKERGTGLGLASAYGIVKSHGGEIQVKSAPGKGTTFFVYLPIKR